MPRFATCIAFVALTTGLLHAGSVAAAAGHPCSRTAINGGTAVLEGSVWRMEVLVDETAYTGPSISDRLNHNWNQQAKRNHRWTSAVMPVDAGTSTRLMTISAAIIAESVPLLRQGDIVDVAIVSGIDYRKGRAPVIVRRVCGGRDVRCLDGLRRMQEGRAAGVKVGGGYSVAGDRKHSPPLANRGRSALWGGCRGEVAAVLQ